jgi:DNA topoisomerase-1
MGPKIYKKKSTYTSTVSTNIGDAIYLIIVESPSKCGKIESYLGQNYKCIASKGHIRELNGLKNIDIKNNFKPTFSIIKEKAGHIKTMREIIQKFSKENVILATDDDREGEGIAWHICELFNLPIETTKRILFHEITQNAIMDAVKTPTTVNMNIVKAQQARQILDIIVGFKISPHLWKHIFSSKSNALSAGRCQTPALRLVYENEMERREKGLEKKYKTTGIFTSKKIEFVLGHEFDKEEEVEIFMNKSMDHSHMMSIEKDKGSIKTAPKPFNTSRLLQVASNVVNTGPKLTMQLCQSLYQNGFITYMRTDSTKYAPPFLDTAKKYISQTFGEDYLGQISNIINNNKENPHEAIRVTDITRTTITTTNSKEVSMYKLIWRNTIESCMANAKYLNTNVLISAPDIIVNKKSKKVYYSHMIEMPVFLGWKIINTKELLTEEIMGLKLYLKTLTSKPVLYSKIQSNVVIRNKTSYYTESSLIKKLEDLGIGRPSTFATLIDTIQERGYVKCTDIVGESKECTEFKLSNGILDKIIIEKVFGNEKSKLQIQQLGILCIEFLVKNFETLFSYDYTENMETKLDEIATATNSDDWSKICETCLNEITTLSKGVEKTKKERYILDENHEMLFTQYGPSIKKTEDGVVSYLKPNTLQIDIEKLKNSEYEVEELLEKGPDNLGTYKNFDLKIKTGKYGNYLEYGTTRVSIKEWKRPISDMDYKTAVKLLEERDKTTTTMLRTMNSELSIRNGKYGPYIFFKTETMKTPKFYPLKKCPHEYKTCDESILIEWITATYLEGK